MRNTLREGGSKGPMDFTHCHVSDGVGLERTITKTKYHEELHLMPFHSYRIQPCLCLAFVNLSISDFDLLVRYGFVSRKPGISQQEGNYHVAKGGFKKHVERNYT